MSQIRNATSENDDIRPESDPSAQGSALATFFVLYTSIIAQYVVLPWYPRRVVVGSLHAEVDPSFAFTLVQIQQSLPRQ